MLDVGLLRKGDPVELIEGELFGMVAMYNPQVYAVAKLNRELTRAYP